MTFYEAVKQEVGMLTDTQRLVMGSYRSDEVVSRISKFLDRSSQVLMSLFSPEDTSGNPDEGQMQIVRHDPYDFKGLVKVLFWVAISISIALLIGRLG